MVGWVWFGFCFVLFCFISVCFAFFSHLQVDACFKKFDKDKDSMLNFQEFKNFMGKRKSLPDKVAVMVCQT